MEDLVIAKREEHRLYRNFFYQSVLAEDLPKAIVDGYIYVNDTGNLLKKVEFDYSKWHKNMPDVKEELPNSVYLYDNAKDRPESYKGILTIEVLIERASRSNILEF